MSDIAAALCAAQAEFPEILKDKENPFLKNRYASLDAIITATRPVLAKHGLALTHQVRLIDMQWFCVSILMHTGGESMENAIPLFFEGTMQSFGGALTYARRYGDSGLLNVAADEDDDGHSAGQKPKTQAKKTEPASQKKQPAPQYTQKQLLDIARNLYATANTKDELTATLGRISDKRGLFENIETFNEALKMVLDRIQELLESKSLSELDAVEIHKAMQLRLAKLPGMVTAAEIEQQGQEALG